LTSHFFKEYPMFCRLQVATLYLASLLFAALLAPSVHGQEDPAAAEVRAASAQLAKHFNVGDASALAAMFAAPGEFIDEQGNVYQGQAEIKQLLTAYFAKFPGVKVEPHIERVRLVGPVAIEEGTRTTTTKAGEQKARSRYIAVWLRTTAGLQIVSLRDFADDPPPTAHDNLQPLAWLVGDWVNEGSDAVVKIAYRWSEDRNFILGDFHVTTGGQVTMKSTQRIGWDPLVGKVRAWMFDSDGGFGEAHWTPVGESWVIKSSATLPDGQTGSATITLTPAGKDRYVMKGTDRIAGSERVEDFEFHVVKQPPAAGK
jgi:uncharacterized protein (TIGR02246 family)